MNIDLDQLVMLGAVVTGFVEFAKPYLKRYIANVETYRILVALVAFAASLVVAAMNSEAHVSILDTWRATFALSRDVWSVIDTVFFGFLIFIVNHGGSEVIGILTKLNEFGRAKVTAAQAALPANNDMELFSRSTRAVTDWGGKPIVMDESAEAQG